MFSTVINRFRDYVNRTRVSPTRKPTPIRLEFLKLEDRLMLDATSPVGRMLVATTNQGIGRAVVATFPAPDPQAGVNDFAAAVDWGGGAFAPADVVARQGYFEVVAAGPSFGG